MKTSTAPISPLPWRGLLSDPRATFAIGASEQDRNLHLELNPLSRSTLGVDCNNPHPEAAARDSCSYGLAFNASTNPDGTCSADGRPVDCKWLEIVQDLDACTCTSAEVFRHDDLGTR